jgi:hypothetical protein
VTAHRLRVGLGVAATVVLTGLAVWLAVTAVHTAAYPPLELGGRVVAGPYELTEVRGDRVGAATVCAVAAVAALAWSVSVSGWLSTIRAASRR